MKKILLIALLAFCMNAKAQITLEHDYDSASTLNNWCTYNAQLMIINFAVSGYQYVKINRCGMVISIYDINHSLLKNISLAGIPENYSGGGIGPILYISENLFSTDSKKDFMYTYDFLGTSGTQYVTDIYNEDGILLFSDTGVALIQNNIPLQQYPIYNTSQGTKMILSHSNGHAKVFSLPGTLPSCCNTDGINSYAVQTLSSLSNAYPNPNNGSAKIDYTLPDGVNEGEIVFYNLMGNEVKRFKVDRTFNTLFISTKDIAAGTYYYQLQTAGESSGGKKMVVIK